MPIVNGIMLRLVQLLPATPVQYCYMGADYFYYVLLGISSLQHLNVLCSKMTKLSYCQQTDLVNQKVDFSTFFKEPGFSVQCVFGGDKMISRCGQQMVLMILLSTGGMGLCIHPGPPSAVWVWRAIWNYSVLTGFWARE